MFRSICMRASFEQIEQINGGGWLSWTAGAACAGLIVGAVAGGPMGLVVALTLGPTVCGGGITAAIILD